MIYEGYSIIPLKPNSKTPVIPWKKYTTQIMDATELKKYFGNGKNYNVGIVTGKISKLVVFDADTPETIEFLESFNIFKNTLKVLTKRGKHYYIRVFDLSDSFPSQKIYHKNIRIDVKANNAYVVAPPSIVDGHTYEFIGSDIVQITQKELEKLISDLKAKFSETHTHIKHHTPYKNQENRHRHRINLRRLKKVVKEHYIEGNRQNLVMYTAGFLAKNGVDLDTAIAFISEIATECRDKELTQRIACVRHTYQDYENGLPIKGELGLIELGISETDLKKVFVEQKKQVRITINIPEVTELLEEYLREKNISIDYDSFYVKIFVNDKQIDRETEIRIQSDLERMINRRIPDEIFFKAIEFIAYKNKRDRLIEFLEKCKNEWDGKPRIHSFFHDVFKLPLNKYYTTLAKNFFVSAIARAYKPGCFLKNIIVFQGPQNLNKSRVLMALGKEWHREINVSITLEKDFYLALQGVWFAEIPEMEALRKAERSRIKAIISGTIDRFRPPYQRNVKDFPRRCIFTCTTNDIFIYDDPSGGTRFWIVEVKNKGNVEYVEENRIQLFGEAVVLFENGYKYWELDEKKAKRMQESARKYDEWESIIGNFVEAHGIKETTVAEIAKLCLSIKEKELDKNKQMRIAECLTVLGFTKKHVWVGGKTRKVWVRKNK